MLSGALLFPQTAWGALLYIDPAEASVYRGDTLTVAVRLDTDEGECINTVDAVIEYDSSIRAVDVSRGDSILSIWVEDPVINEEAHTITFAGGIPGGYCGRIAGDPSLTNVIAELVFRSPGFSIGGSDSAQAALRFGEATQVLLHDGFGSLANVRTQGAMIKLERTAGQATEDSWTARVESDTNPPADFEVTLAQEEMAFSGQYFITFNTQDKQSGIDHYEVMEEPFEDFNLFKWGAQDAPWVTAESPYVLKDQSLNSTIRVKAIDKAGLERVVVLVPDEALRSISMARTVTFLVVGIGITVLILFGGYTLWRRKQKLIEQYSQSSEEKPQDEKLS